MVEFVVALGLRESLVNKVISFYYIKNYAQGHETVQLKRVHVKWGVATISITTYNLTTLNIKGLFATLSNNDI
jgi:hypothetical protein